MQVLPRISMEGHRAISNVMMIVIIGVIEAPEASTETEAIAEAALEREVAKEEDQAASTAKVAL